MADRKIVVVGASAGGLEGLVQLVRGLPPKLEASVFVVMHLSPSAKSNLAAILGKGAALDVVALDAPQTIAAGRVYVALPDRHLVIEEDRVSSSCAPPDDLHRPSIDVLFRSAATAFGKDVIGVVLSGMLHDGTEGLRWIKRHGGTAIVQDPQEALFAAMPASAIENVDVDWVLRAGEIAGAISALVEGGSPAERAPAHETA